jgi:hypothetical protein
VLGRHDAREQRCAERSPVEFEDDGAEDVEGGVGGAATAGHARHLHHRRQDVGGGGVDVVDGERAGRGEGALAAPRGHHEPTLARREEREKIDGERTESVCVGGCHVTAFFTRRADERRACLRAAAPLSAGDPMRGAPALAHQLQRAMAVMHTMCIAPTTLPPCDAASRWHSDCFGGAHNAAQCGARRTPCRTSVAT